MHRLLGCAMLSVVTAGCPLVRAAAGDDTAAAGRSDAAALFKQLDVNTDGQLTSDEASGDKERLFKRLVRTSDKDGNGQLSVEEFATGLSGDQPAAAETPQTPPDKAERRREPGAMFQRLDANGDGKVERDEMPTERRAMFSRMLERADTNGDGALEREEFAKLGPPPGAPIMRPMAGPVRLAAALDTNSDGELSAEEIAAAQASLKKLDRDGDGKISRQELAEAGPDRAANKETSEASHDDVDLLVKRALGKDQNSDSRLSPEEAPKNLQKAFAKIDTNGDGQLDAQELKARFASAQKKQRAKPDKSKKSDKSPN